MLLCQYGIVLLALRVAEAPGAVGAVRPVETGVHAVLLAGSGQRLVVGGRGLQLLGRLHLGEVRQTTVGQLPEAGRTRSSVGW